MAPADQLLSPHTAHPDEDHRVLELQGAQSSQGRWMINLGSPSSPGSHS